MIFVFEYPYLFKRIRLFNRYNRGRMMKNKVTKLMKKLIQEASEMYSRVFYVETTHFT